MKKKIFLVVVAVAMLIFALAICASADNIVPQATNEYGTLTTFDEAIGNTSISQLKDDGTIARTVIFDGTNYYTIPTTYVLTESPKNVNGETKQMFLLSFGEIGTKLGATFDKNSLIRLEIPSDIDYLANGNENLSNCNNIVEIIINDGLCFWENSQFKAFTNCKKLKSIDISKMVIQYPRNAFALFEYCEELEYVKLPPAYQNGTTYVEYETDHMFSGCKKLEIIENFDAFFGNLEILSYKTFYNCYLLDEIKLWDGLETIEGRALGNCSSITSIYIPNSVTQIGTSETVFESCTSLEKIILPPTVSLGDYCFEKCTALTDVWMPTGASTFGKQVFGQCSSSLQVNFYFHTATSPITITNTELNKDPFITALNTEGDSRIKYNTPLSTKCSVFYNGHTVAEGENDCTKDIICSICETVLTEAYEEHDLTIVIEYENGYLAVGYKRESCSRCAHLVEEATLPLFVSLGYSAPENGDGGISIGYTANSSAIDDYEAVTGKTVTYGLFVVLQKSLGASDDVLDENGTPISGAVAMQIPYDKFPTSCVKMVGFETAEQKSASFAFGAYVIMQKGEEPKEISYMQEGTALDGDRYVFTTFNEIVSKVNGN